MSAEGSLDDFESDWPDDDDLDAYEEAIAECMLGRDGVCLKAGSEECDWECPLRDLAK